MFCVRVHLELEVGESDRDRDRDRGGGNGEEQSVDILEVVQGTVHLFRDVSTKSENPEAGFERLQIICDKNICILGLPRTMEPGDFLQITSSFSDSMRKVQCIRSSRNEGNQVILLRFDTQDSAEAFLTFYNGNLLPGHVFPIATVDYTSSSDVVPPGFTEIPTCTVCLERLDEHISGVPTSFSTNFTPGDSCLVCRYCSEPETSTCSACPTSENLWVCVICGFVGCGRYKEGHAIKHWKETKHSYSLELDSQRIWDYVGDNYVHRIIQSRSDGNLVELTAPSSEGNDECSGCSRRPEAYDHAYKSMLQTLEFEYNTSLASQTESQRKYYEERLEEIQLKRDNDIAAGIEKHASARFQKLQAKLDKVEEEKKFLTQVNQCFTDNQKGWEQKLRDLEERGKFVIKRKDERISDLEKQIQDMMASLDKPKPKSRGKTRT